MTKLASKEIKEKFQQYICYGLNIYSTFKTMDDLEFKVEKDGQPYKIRIEWTKSITTTDPECRDFYSIFYKRMLRDMKFERSGRSLFAPKRSVSI